MLKKLRLKIAEKLHPNFGEFKKKSELINKIHNNHLASKAFAKIVDYVYSFQDKIYLTKNKEQEKRQIKTQDGYDSYCDNKDISDYFHDRYKYNLCSLSDMSQDPLIDKIIRMPASDALSSGYKINWEDDVPEHVKNTIEKSLIDYNADNVIRKAIEDERIYGTGVILPVFNAFDADGIRDKNKERDYYFKKYQKNNIAIHKNFTGFRILSVEDMSFNNIEYNDILSPSYKIPMSININGFSIHTSHLIKLKSRKKHGRLSSTDYFIGQSVVAQVVREIYNWETSSKVSIDLLKTKRDKVLSVSKENMQDMSCYMGLDATESFGSMNGSRYIEQLQSMSNDTTMVIQNGDALNVLQTTLSDVPNLNEYLMRNIAVVTQIPITKLFGASPAGLSSTGESDTKNYSQYLKSIQNDLIRPSLQQMVKIIADMYDFDCFGCSIEFNPIDAPTQSELMDNLSKQANAIKTLIDAGVLTEEESRQLLNDTEGNGIVGLKTIEYEEEETDDEIN